MAGAKVPMGGAFESPANKVLRGRDREHGLVTKGELCRNGGREGATSAVVVARSHTSGVENLHEVFRHNDVWCIEFSRRARGEVTPLDHDEATSPLQYELSQLDHAVDRGDVFEVDTREQTGFTQVGGDDRSEWQERLLVHLEATSLHQGVSAGRHEDRVDDHVREQAVRGGSGHRFNSSGSRQHASFDSRHGKIRGNGVDLRTHHFGFERAHCGDRGGVLGGHGGDGGRAVDATRGEGAKVSLNARPASGIAPGNSHHDARLHPATLPRSHLSGYAQEVSEPLLIGSLSLTSRLVMGTGAMASLDILEKSLLESGTQIATVSVRRVSASVDGSIYELLERLDIDLLPNTAGCYTARDAVVAAELGREAFGTPRVKLEVIGDERSLLPDVLETLSAAKTLVERGFEVWAYTTDDLVAAQRLEQLGCVAVMPLGSPIGSGCGINNPQAVATVAARLHTPVLLDAGIGTASDAALAMELGCAGVLVASAINRAKDPVMMAAAMRDGVTAGYAASRAGRIAWQSAAVASSPRADMPAAVQD